MAGIGLTIEDPLGFIADIKRNTTIFQWVSLLMQMFMSSLVSFCFTCGSIMAAKGPVPVAIGTGLISVAIAVSALFARSPLTKGMFLIRPEKEAEAELNADLAITERNPKL